MGMGSLVCWPHGAGPGAAAPARACRRIARRPFLFLAPLLAVGVTLFAGPTWAEGAAPALGALRVNKVRQQTFLIEMGPVRILVDPWFTKVPLRGLLRVGAPALDENAVGRVDLILVPDGAWLRSSSLSALNNAAAYCIVPNERVARRFRHAGFRRVRVAQGGDIIKVAGARIEVSAARNRTCDDCLGFYIQVAGRTVWHTGPIAPLGVEPGPGRFAQDHPSEVVMAPVNELFAAASWRTGQADARLLGELAGARFVMPHSNDVEVSAPLRFFAGRFAPPALVDEELRYSARFVPMEAGLWYRVARP